MPALRRDGYVYFAIPAGSVKLDADGFAALENTAVVAGRIVQKGYHFLLGFVGSQIGGAEAVGDVVKFLGEVDGGHGAPHGSVKLATVPAGRPLPQCAALVS